MPTNTFIAKAHTNFTSILMEAQSQDEFVKHITALAKHVRDVHEWEGRKCDFHPLRVCTCGTCDNREQLMCEGKLNFHALLYEIECHERAAQFKKIGPPNSEAWSL